MFASRIIHSCENIKCCVLIGHTERKAGTFKTTPRRTTSSFGHLRPKNWNRRQTEYNHMFYEPGLPVRENACWCRLLKVEKALHTAFLWSVWNWLFFKRVVFVIVIGQIYCLTTLDGELWKCKNQKLMTRLYNSITILISKVCSYQPGFSRPMRRTVYKTPERTPQETLIHSNRFWRTRTFPTLRKG